MLSPRQSDGVSGFAFCVSFVAFRVKHPFFRGVIKPQTTMSVASPYNETVVGRY